MTETYAVLLFVYTIAVFITEFVRTEREDRGPIDHTRA